MPDENQILYRKLYRIFFYIENFTYLYHIHFVHLKKISTSIVIQNA